MCSGINTGDQVTGTRVALRGAPWLGGQLQVTPPEFPWDGQVSLMQLIRLEMRILEMEVK